MGRGQTGVQGMADHASPHGGVVDLQMALGVPGQRADPVAQAQPQRLQGPGQPIAARQQRRIADPPYRPPMRGRHDLAIG